MQSIFGFLKTYSFYKKGQTCPDWVGKDFEKAGDITYAIYITSENTDYLQEDYHGKWNSKMV